MITNIFIPNNINILILKKKNLNNLYFYSKTTFFLINLNNFNIKFNKFLNILSLYKINNVKTNIIKDLNKFLFSWETFFFKKIIFLGKSFKLKKKQNIFFFFNYSHTVFLIIKNNFLKKIQKNKILFFYKNYLILNNFLKKITNIKQNNIYTKRGLRLSRQLILKRKGKSN